MRKVINRQDNLVSELLEGFSLAFRDKIKLTDERIIVRRKAKDKGKVALVTLGGSGHEPALSGFVGKGLLDASVPGEIFAAPGPKRCLTAMRDADQGAGVLFIVLNHAGDVLTANFALSMAKKEGLNVKMVLIHDDIASGSKDNKEERRGLVGIISVIKIAGAAAEAGLNLEKVNNIATAVVNNTRTLAVGFSQAAHPVTGALSQEIPENSMVIGLGQHGEKSGETMDMTSADKLADLMLFRLIDDLDVKQGEDVLILLNGSGATTLMELYIIFRRLFKTLDAKGINLLRNSIGEFITSQEQAGFQINITRLNPAMLDYWDAPCDAPFL